jgi:L-2-hydroxycarboxylate dehydrogenase (NAD+)
MQVFAIAFLLTSSANAIFGKPSLVRVANFPNGGSQSTAASLCKSIFKVIEKNLDNTNSQSVKEELTHLLTELLSHPGQEEKSRALFEIGKQVYGIDVLAEHSKNNHPVASSSDTTSGSVKQQDATANNFVLDFKYMRRFMIDVFESYGVPPERAEVCANVLVAADERGIHSHGLGRLKPIYCDRMDAGILFPDQPIDVIRETDTTALLDGNLGLGLYVGPFAMQMAIDKAKKHGVGFVVVKNSTHYGIAGYFARMATTQGCVGFTGTNARPSITPTYGVEPMMGTNPLCFGIPADEPFDFVIDCATSINQRGKIEKYAREGVDTPKGCVIDNDGIQRTDTEGILRDLVLGKCALTPLGGAGIELGGYKGYGWAATVELLCIAFQSGPFGAAISGVDADTGKPCPMPLGHFFLAIDIEAICPLATFKENVGNFLRALRASKKSPLGPGRIWTAGEPEHDAWLRQSKAGGMSVPQVLQDNMIHLRDRRPGLKDKYPIFPFEEVPHVASQ